jgi:hypothetical protein
LKKRKQALDHTQVIDIDIGTTDVESDDDIEFPIISHEDNISQCQPYDLDDWPGPAADADRVVDENPKPEKRTKRNKPETKVIDLASELITLVSNSLKGDGWLSEQGTTINVINIDNAQMDSDMDDESNIKAAVDKYEADLRRFHKVLILLYMIVYFI